MHRNGCLCVCVCRSMCKLRCFWVRTFCFLGHSKWVSGCVCVCESRKCCPLGNCLKCISQCFNGLFWLNLFFPSLAFNFVRHAQLKKRFQTEIKFALKTCRNLVSRKSNSTSLMFHILHAMQTICLFLIFQRV